MGGPKYPGTFPEYPGCYILRIRGCFIWTEETARAGSLATIRAPALEELACPRTRGTELVELDGCTSVRLLGKVRGGHGRPAQEPRARVLHPIRVWSPPWTTERPCMSGVRPYAP